MDTAETKATPRSRWSFRGPDGIRSGYCLAIFLLIWGASLAVSLICLGYALHLDGPPKGPISAGAGLLLELAEFIPVLLATAVMARLERRSLLAYGLRELHPLRRYLGGGVAGFCSLTLLLALMLAGGYFALDGLALSGVSAVTQGALWLIVFTLTGIGEECLWRGYIQTTLTRGMGFWRAGILASLLFALAHSTNPGETALGIAQVFVAGMIFVVILRVSGSLWPGIGFHAGWDWGQSYFYGTPDSGFLSDGHLLNSHPVGAALFSGGSVGPEGSVLATPVFLLGASIFVWLLRRLPKK